MFSSVLETLTVDPVSVFHFPTTSGTYMHTEVLSGSFDQYSERPSAIIRRPNCAVYSTARTNFHGQKKNFFVVTDASKTFFVLPGAFYLRKVRKVVRKNVCLLAVEYTARFKRSRQLKNSSACTAQASSPDVMTSDHAREQQWMVVFSKDWEGAGRSVGFCSLSKTNAHQILRIFGEFIPTYLGGFQVKLAYSIHCIEWCISTHHECCRVSTQWVSFRMHGGDNAAAVNWKVLEPMSNKTKVIWARNLQPRHIWPADV